jgi:hypothetical protein
VEGAEKSKDGEEYGATLEEKERVRVMNGDLFIVGRGVPSGDRSYNTVGPHGSGLAMVARVRPPAAQRRFSGPRRHYPTYLRASSCASM